MVKFLSLSCLVVYSAMASTVLIDSSGSPSTDFAIGGAQGYGMQFTTNSSLPAAGSLLQISAPFDIAGSFTTFVEILSDSGGVPSSVLWSSAPVTIHGNGVTTANYTITGSSFQPNTSYWIGLMFDPSQPGNIQLIENNPTVTSALNWTLNSGNVDALTGGTWDNVASCGGGCTGLAFDITAVTVPEIPTALFSTIGLLFLPAIRRRFQKR